MAWAAVVSTVAVGLALGYGPAWFLLIGGAVMVPVERRFRRHDHPLVRPGLRTDIVHLLFTDVLGTACLLAAVGITAVVLSPLTIGATERWIGSQSFAVQVVLAMVLLQVTFYVAHRLAHRWSLLWRFHAIHHSSEQLDWLAAPRLHPFEALISGFVMAPAFVILGFVPVSIAAVSSLQTVWAVFIHGNVRWRMRALDRVWPNPEFHHWHHSSEPDAIDKNFGHPLLDTLFGTYYMPADRRPERYGIGRPVPDSYLGQLALPFRGRPPSDVVPTATPPRAPGPSADTFPGGCR